MFGLSQSIVPRLLYFQAARKHPRGRPSDPPALPRSLPSLLSTERSEEFSVARTTEESLAHRSKANSLPSSIGHDGGMLSTLFGLCQEIGRLKAMMKGRPRRAPT